MANDRNECNPGDAANSAALAADHAAQEELLTTTQAAVHAAAVDGLVNIQMAHGPYIPTYPGDAAPPSVNGRVATPGPVVQATEEDAVRLIVRGDATLA